MREELRRIDRLTQVRIRKLHEAQLALVEADREAAALLQIVREAEAGLRAAVDEASQSEFALAGEFTFRREQIDAAQRRLLACEKRHQQAMAVRKERHEAVLEAHKGLKQMESWAESVKRTFRQEEDRRERILSDEIAARRFGLAR